MNEAQINRIISLATELLELTKGLAPAAPQGSMPVEVIDQPLVERPPVVTASPVVNEPVIETSGVTEKPVVTVKPVVPTNTVNSAATKNKSGVISADELDAMFGGVP